VEQKRTPTSNVLFGTGKRGLKRAQTGANNGFRWNTDYPVRNREKGSWEKVGDREGGLEYMNA